MKDTKLELPTIKENIDFEALLNLVIFNDEEKILNSNANFTNRKNLLEYQNYKNIDKQIDKYLKLMQRSKKTIFTKENSSQENDYKSIAINKKPHGKDLQLHISPNDKNLYIIINELIRQGLINKKGIYFKYTRENVKDKIIIFLENKEDYKDKINILKQIKNKYPFAFENLDKSLIWFNETEIPGVFININKPVKKQNGSAFISNETIVKTALEEVKTLLYFALKETNLKENTPLKDYNKQYLLLLFKNICLEVFKRYGLLFSNIEYNFTKSLEYPGINQPLNHNFTFNEEENTLEYGERKCSNVFKFYQIPLKHKSNINIYDNLKSYNSFDLDIDTYNKRIKKCNNNKNKIRNLK